MLQPSHRHHSQDETERKLRNVQCIVYFHFNKLHVLQEMQLHIPGRHNDCQGFAVDGWLFCWTCHPKVSRELQGWWELPL
jgi:hypothetical protein